MEERSGSLPYMELDELPEDVVGIDDAFLDNYLRGVEGAQAPDPVAPKCCPRGRASRMGGHARRTAHAVPHRRSRSELAAGRRGLVSQIAQALQRCLEGKLRANFLAPMHSRAPRGPRGAHAARWYTG